MHLRDLLARGLIVALALCATACEAPEWPTDTPPPPATATPFVPTDVPATAEPAASPTEAEAMAAPTEPPATLLAGVGPTRGPATAALYSTPVAPSAPRDTRRESGATYVTVALEPPRQLDPARAATTAEIAVANAIYNRLVDITPDGQLVPGLAESWVAHEGGLIYDIALTPGASFHNGADLSADDVVWSLNRLRDPGQGLASGALLGSVKSIDGVGDDRVLIELTRPDTQFMYELADHRAAIVRYGVDNPSITLNGTGPFTIESAAADEFASLAAHGAYHEAGRPAVDRLELRFYDAPVFALRAILAGEVDIVLELPMAECLELEGEPGISIYEHEIVRGRDATCSAVREGIEGFLPHLVPGLTDLSTVTFER